MTEEEVATLNEDNSYVYDKVTDNIY
jgi:hypothetical protein